MPSPRSHAERRARGVAAAALLLCALAACERPAARTEATTTSLAGQTPERRERRAAAQTAVDGARRTALVAATERVAPAVVSISVASRRQVPRSPWDYFFVPDAGTRVVQGYGTGFIVGADGVVITNQHVVAGAEQVTVTLADGSESPARVVGEDAVTDIAVLRIDRTRLPTAPLGTSSDLMIGEWVLAIGNPYAFLLGNSEPTVTAGVVSATNRNILPTDGQPGLYLDMIQTDAPINPGNSGGPLTNALGEVVGVNSSIFSQSGGSIGLGFAIPIERAMSVAGEILRSGTVRRAWTGIDVEGASAMRNWKSAGGVVVSSVAPGGPGARAGVRPGDVLVAANGRTLRNYLDWEAAKLDLHVGDAIDLSVRNGDRIGTRRLETSDLPTATAEKVTVLRDLQVVSVTPQIQAERNVRSSEGALIFAITPEVSRATGLRTGDVIVAVNRFAVASADQLAEALELVRAGRAFRIYFERNGTYSFTDLVLR
jgi:serine protease Do